MLATLLIGLRECLEASLVVGILSAFLVRTGRRNALPRVRLGVGIAVAISVGVTFVLTRLQQALTQAQETLGGVLSIVDEGFLTWVILWMRRAGRSISAQLRGRMEDALQMGSSAVVVMAAPAGGRQGWRPRSPSPPRRPPVRRPGR